MIIKEPDYLSSSGFAQFYEQASGKDPIECLSDFFRTANISFVMPSQYKQYLDQRIEVMPDPVEDYSYLPPDVFFKRLKIANTMTFTIWDSTLAAIFFEIKKNNGWWLERYGIIHMPDSVFLVTKLVERFVAAAMVGKSQLLVVDWRADTETVDWDEFWQGNIILDECCPQILGIPDRLFSKLKVNTDGFIVETLLGHHLLKWKGILS